MTSSGTFTLWTMYTVHCPVFNKQTNKRQTKKQDQQLLSKSTHSVWRGWGGGSSFPSLHKIKRRAYS